MLTLNGLFGCLLILQQKKGFQGEDFGKFKDHPVTSLTSKKKIERERAV